MLKKNVQEIGYTMPDAKRHSLGPCMQGLLVNSNTVTLINRTSQWVRTGLVDMAFGMAVVNWLEFHTNRDYNFQWIIRQLQLDSVQIVPMIEKFGLRGQLAMSANWLGQETRKRFDEACAGTLQHHKLSSIRKAGVLFDHYLMEKTFPKFIPFIDFDTNVPVADDGVYLNSSIGDEEDD